MAASETAGLSARARTVLPTDHGDFATLAFDIEGTTHVALLAGDPAAVDAPLVRLHSECLTGDALGSHRCDCGDQLQAALAAIAAAGCGVLVYLRGHEGRGIGLGAKLEAYALQDAGLDTVDANRSLGFPDDARDYTAASQILTALGVRRIRLLSGNPAKAEALAGLGIGVVERLTLPVADRPENAGYLATKRARMRHEAPHDVGDAAPAGEVVAGPVGEAAARPAGEVVAGPASEGTAGTSATGASGPEGDAANASGPDYQAIAASGEVIAQLAQSLDGFIAARDGDAEFVSGEADRTHLHRLRAAAAVVLVGAGTVCSDDPQLTVRAVPGPNPVRAVLDPHARVPVTARVLSEPAAPTLWLLGAGTEAPAGIGEHVTVVRLPEPAGGTVAPEAVRALLAEHAPGTVLVEGGGQTVSRFLAAGALDRLFLTLAPVLIGDGVPGIRFTGSPVMAEALRAPFHRYTFGADVCHEFLLSAAARQHGGQLRSTQ